MRVILRLLNQGHHNHPYWWIVAQPIKKKLGGRYLEHLGIWAPIKRQTVPRQIAINKHRMRYWLANGAIPSERVQRLLEKFNFVPKAVSPFGSKHVYEKPER